MNWKRLLALTHNYLGFALSLLFVFWFGSGIVMLYKDYPNRTTSERLRAKQALTPESVEVSPKAAVERSGLSGQPESIQLHVLADRPAYKIKGTNGHWTTVYADNGNRFAFDREFGKRSLAAAGFDGSVRRWDRMEQPDQWTLTSFDFDAHKPLHRARLSDESGHFVYLSSRTGDVVQAVSFSGRVWGYLGAVTHWIYPTILRKRVALWDGVVVWSSLFGTILCLLGLLVGLVFLRWDQLGRWLQSFLPGSDTTNSKPIVPYRGWLNWHTCLGFAFGLIACTWIFSGMLSMSPFGWHAYPQAGTVEEPLRAEDYTPIGSLERSPSAAISTCRREIKPREVRVLRLRSRYYYYCLESPTRTRLVPASGNNRLLERFPGDRLLTAVRATGPDETITEATVMGEYDNYLYPGRAVRFGSAAPRLPYLRVKTDDSAASWFYVDLHTGQLLKTVRYRDRWNRWLYHGLHNLDFPFLYQENRHLWWWAMWGLLLGGLGVSFTGLWLTVRWASGWVSQLWR